MFKPLSPEEYRALALSRYPTLNPEFEKLNLWKKTGGWNNPQNTYPVYLGVAQLDLVDSHTEDTRTRAIREGRSPEEALGRVIRVYRESEPKGLCGDPLNPETIEGRLYLREEFEPHIKVPKKLGKSCESVSKKIYETIFLSPETLRSFPEFEKQYKASSLKDMRWFALRDVCSQAAVESPLFEVYQRFDGLYVVVIDKRAESLITEDSLKSLN